MLFDDWFGADCWLESKRLATSSLHDVFACLDFFWEGLIAQTLFGEHPVFPVKSVKRGVCPQCQILREILIRKAPPL